MATLTVTHSEKLTLNGASQGSTTTQTYSGINDVYKRILEVPSTEITLYTTSASAVGGSQFESDLMEYIRITNLDAANNVTIIMDAGDEVAYKIPAGDSFIITNHQSSWEGTASGADVVVTDGTAAVHRMTVTDGDLASGMVENEYVSLTDSKSLTKKYVIVDDNATTVATGDILLSTSDVGGTTAGSGNAGGIAVAINTTGSVATQNDFLVQFKAAIEHANGHGASSFTVSSVPGEADGAQYIDITSVYKGTSGNTLPTTDISQLAPTAQTAGVDASVAGLSTILTVNAISETTSSAGSKVELFIASK